MSDEQDEVDAGEEEGGDGIGAGAAQASERDSDGAPEQSSDNPLGDALDVTVSIPETLEIKMVDATVLSDYEVWQFITSILGAAVVGFAVAWFNRTGTNNTLLAITLLCVLLFVIALKMTFKKREQLTKKSRSIRMRAVGEVKKE